MQLTLCICLLIILSPTISQAQNCSPTPHRTTGTHYKPVTEHKLNISSGVTVTGRILEALTCKPVSNARVAHWQAGSDGHYQDRLRAYLITNAKGEYTFETEWPALSVPHIHFIITTDGYDQLETQWRGTTKTGQIQFDMFLTKSQRQQ